MKVKRDKKLDELFFLEKCQNENRKSGSDTLNELPVTTGNCLWSGRAEPLK